MEGKHRCIKCGRVLKSQLSIMRGIGSTCAGDNATSGMGIHVGKKAGPGVASKATGPGKTQSAVITGDLPEKKLSNKELARQRREERRQRLEQHEPFECGILLPRRVPLVFVPLDGSTWKEDPSGRMISHKHLQEYLKRYHFI